MIAQVLNRPFLLEVASLVQDELGRELKQRESGRRRDLDGPLAEVENDELRALAASLEQARGSEDVAEEGPGGEGTPKDDDAYIPRDPLLSLLQSTIEEYAEESDEVELIDSPSLVGRRGAGEIPAVTDLRIASIPLAAPLAARRIWGDMEIAENPFFDDPGWLTSGFAMAVRAFRGRTRWIEKPPTIKIGERARIILVGDWGSGLRRAKSVADQIRKVLSEDERVERHVVHLGDVYYSGAKREYERNFFNLWPVHAGEDIGSFSLCGNHDMYYGGHAYYGTCLADPLLSRQAGSSHFTLQSPSWTLIALDTGYEDGGLKGHQAEWAKELIDQAPADQRIGLLSHHQLFSAHEDGAKVLGEKIEPVLATERINAWFWGHEHRCIQYGESQQRGHRVGFASCLGHGGVPEHMIMKETDPDPPVPWEYEYLKPFREGEPWERFGFAVVDIDGREMSIRYIDEHGTEHHNVKSV